MAGVYEQASVGEPNSTAGPKWVAQFKGMNEALDSSNKLEAKSLSAGVLGRWYTPKIIATEETRENVAFGTLTTADEVTGVVLPENGIIAVGYAAMVKSSSEGQGRLAIFIGSNQLKAGGGTLESEGSTTGFTPHYSCPGGILRIGTGTSFSTTGQAVGTQATGGLCYIYAAAGTYSIGVRFKALTGSVTAKERKLWVGVIGL